MDREVRTDVHHNRLTYAEAHLSQEEIEKLAHPKQTPAPGGSA